MLLGRVIQWFYDHRAGIYSELGFGFYHNFLVLVCAVLIFWASQRFIVKT